MSVLKKRPKRTAGKEKEIMPESSTTQKLHGATFESESNSSTSECEVDDLLEKIGQGFRDEDATNFDKLNIARKYGPLLLDLKKIVPHGKFQETLKKRFPKVSYAKCNRWMFVAMKEAEVAAAIAEHPDVAWGPKKMVDYLKGYWSLDNDEDEEDAIGSLEEDCINDEPLLPQKPDESPAVAEEAVLPESVLAVEDGLDEEEWPDEEETPIKQLSLYQDSLTQPLDYKTDYQVEIRLRLKTESESSDDVVAEFQTANRWRIEIDTVHEYEISEMEVVVNTDSMDR